MKEKIKNFINKLDGTEKLVLGGLVFLLIATLLNGHIEMGVFIAIGLIAAGISIIKEGRD